MEDKLLIIFVKNLVLGKVKTRLAQSIGDEAALEVYKFLLEHTRREIEKVQCDKAIYYADYIPETDDWKERDYQQCLQRGTSLGERMELAFDNGFRHGYKRIVTIGSDCAELNQEIITRSFELLTTNDTVIGPALDGGYYLLGLTKMIPAVFVKEWSTASVCRETVKDFCSNNCTYSELEILSDIDTIDDWNRHLANAKI